MAGPHDMKKARSTYVGLLGFLKWGTVASLLIGALVILLIAS